MLFLRSVIIENDTNFRIQNFALSLTVTLSMERNPVRLPVPYCIANFVPFLTYVFELS